MAVSVVDLFAQTTRNSQEADRASLIREFEIPEDKVNGALKLINDLIMSLQNTSMSMVELLSPQNPDRLLDPQVSSRIEQIRRTFSLRLERFHLDLSDLAGEDKAKEIVIRFRSIVPSVLLDPSTSTIPAPAASRPDPSPSPSMQMTVLPPVAQESPLPEAPSAVQPPPDISKPREVPLGSAPIGPSSPSLDLSITGTSNSGSSGGMMGMMKGEMGGMPGMSSGSGSSSSTGMPSADPQAVDQVLSANAAIVRLLSIFTAQPGGITADQLELVDRLLENQSALLRMLSPEAVPEPGVPSDGGMSGMGTM